MPKVNTLFLATNNLKKAGILHQYQEKIVLYQAILLIFNRPGTCCRWRGWWNWNVELSFLRAGASSPGNCLFSFFFFLVLLCFLPRHLLGFPWLPSHDHCSLLEHQLWEAGSGWLVDGMGMHQGKRWPIKLDWGWTSSGPGTWVPSPSMEPVAGSWETPT